MQDDADTISLLCTHGAEVERLASCSGQAPLHICAMQNKLSAARALLHRGADPLLADIHGFSAMDIAEREGHVEMLQILRQHVVTARVDQTLELSDKLWTVCVPVVVIE